MENKPKPMTSGAVSRLFLNMKNRYKWRWDNQFKNEDDYRHAYNLWFEKLKHLNVAQVRTGIDNWIGSEPPTIEQFITACTSDKKTAGIHRPSAVEFNYDYPDSLATEETHQASINKIRSFLR